MTEKDIKVLLDFQHFDENDSLSKLIKAAHENDSEKEDTRFAVMTDDEVEMLAAAGVDSGRQQNKDRRSFIKSLGGLLVFLMVCTVCACKTDSETKYIDQTEIKTTTYTPADATELAYYTQRYYIDENGDKYLQERSEDYVYSGSERKTVTAGTKIAGLGKDIEGFEQYGFTQSGKTLNLYYRAKTITYRFFISETDTKPVITLVGKAGLPLTAPPTKSYTTSGKIARWRAKDDFSPLGKTYGKVNKDYYAAWFTPLGTKERPDAVGDIVFTDGTAVYYADVTNLSEEQQKHAIAVIVSTTYNRTTGNGTGFNEGKLIIGLGTLQVETYWYGWVESNLFKTSTSTNDGRLNHAIIKASGDSFNLFSWVDDYAKNFYTATGIYLTGEFETGWFIPSYSEWLQARISLTPVKKAFDLIGNGINVEDDDFYTSTNTMGILNDKVSWYVRSSKNNLLNQSDDPKHKALSMREFK